MTFLASDSLPMSLTMYLSMVVGIVYSVVLYIYVSRKYGKDSPVTVLPFCVATSFWCYSWANELLILLPVAVFCLSEYGRAPVRMKVLLYCLFVLSSFGPIVPLVLQKFLGDWIMAMEVYSLLCGVGFVTVMAYPYKGNIIRRLR